jgi:hypothetical protein
MKESGNRLPNPSENQAARPGAESGVADATTPARSVALAALQGAIQAGQTGCLTASDAGLGVVEVYVMSGDVLAANSGDDDIRLLSCVSASGRVPIAELDARAERCASPGEFTEALYEILDEEVVQELLYERFRENIFCFLGATRSVEFEPMDSVFVSNLQVSHDSRILVAELAELRARVSPLLGSKLPLLTASGSSNHADPLRLLVACRSGATVNELLRKAGVEPNRVLQAIADLLDSGALSWAVVQPAQPAPTAEPVPPEPEAEPLEPQAEPSELAEPVRVPPPPPMEDESYLDAFGDYDTTRGDGSFSGVRDRVDLLEEVELGKEAPEPEVIDMPEAENSAMAGAVSLNFSGPRLADDDARNKIDVVNEVLETVRSAIDHLNGGGGGNARIQLIVDGSAGPFAALFGGIELQADGRLPVEPVLKNLRKRPVTEHRPLLQRASIDIIERTLSLASEDLDEAQMDDVLEKVAGYQQRLGI